MRPTATDLSHLPTPNCAAFEGRACWSFPELAKLLGMDQKTLRGHVMAGNIGYIDMGLGSRPRREFTLAHVAAFFSARNRVECPSIAPKTRRVTITTSRFAPNFTDLRRKPVAKRPKPLRASD
jgi:hypothetical protein